MTSYSSHMNVDGSNNDQPTSGTMTSETLRIQFRNSLNKYMDMKSNYLSLFSNSDFYILGTGAEDNNLWCYDLNTHIWSLVADDSNGELIGIASSNTNVVYGVFSDNTIHTKPTWDSPTWNRDVSWGNEFISVAVAADNSMIGITTNGLMNYLSPDSIPSENGVIGWQSCTQGNASNVAVTTGGIIWVTNSNHSIYTRTPPQLNQSDISNTPYVTWYNGNSYSCVAVPTGSLPDNGDIYLLGTNNVIYKSNINTPTTITEFSYHSTLITTIAIVAIDKKNEIIQTPSHSLIVSGKSMQSIENTTIDNCSDACQNNDDCFGGLFNNTNNLCTLYDKVGKLVKSSSDNTALLKKEATYVSELERLNDKIMRLNTQIYEESKVERQQLDTSTDESRTLSENLQTQYEELLVERGKLEMIRNEISKHDTGGTDISTQLNQQYAIYFILIFVVLVSIILITMMSRRNAT